jgi:hypothetical protein
MIKGPRFFFPRGPLDSRALHPHVFLSSFFFRFSQGNECRHLWVSHRTCPHEASLGRNREGRPSLISRSETRTRLQLLIRKMVFGCGGEDFRLSVGAPPSQVKRQDETRITYFACFTVRMDAHSSIAVAGVTPPLLCMSQTHQHRKSHHRLNFWLVSTSPPPSSAPQTQT